MRGRSRRDFRNWRICCMNENVKKVKLGDVCFNESSNIAQKDLDGREGEYPIYGASGIIKNIDFYKCDLDYIAIVKDGAGVGRVMKLPAKSSVISTMQYIVPKGCINIDYLYYLLCYLDLSKFRSGSTIPHIYFKDYKNENVSIFSLEEQREIAYKLKCVDNLIEKRQRQLENLDKLIKSQFIEMFGDPEINQHGFDKVTVNDVCAAIVRGPFGSALKKDFFVEKSSKTYKVYEQKHAIQKSATIGTYYIDETKFKELKRFECKPGDFLMSCSGTMGELYQLPADCERGIINQALCKFTLNDKIVPVFFLTYMSQTIGNLETKGSGIKNIAAVSYVKAMPVILPPIDLQNEFALFVERTDKSKFTIKQSLEQLEILKKSLMQKYFG